MTSKANDSPCSSRVDLAVRKTSLVAPWIAPVCLVRVVPSIACWFLAFRKQLVGRLAAHVSLDLDLFPEFFRLMSVACFLFIPLLEPGLDFSRDSHLNGHIQQSWNLWSNYRMVSEVHNPGFLFLDSRLNPRVQKLGIPWPTGSDHFGYAFCFLFCLFTFTRISQLAHTSLSLGSQRLCPSIWP